MIRPLQHPGTWEHFWITLWLGALLDHSFSLPDGWGSDSEALLHRKMSKKVVTFWSALSPVCSDPGVASDCSPDVDRHMVSGLLQKPQLIMTIETIVSFLVTSRTEVYYRNVII